jgi:hypothetical protein
VKKEDPAHWGAAVPKRTKQNAVCNKEINQRIVGQLISQTLAHIFKDLYLLKFTDPVNKIVST